MLDSFNEKFNSFCIDDVKKHFSQEATKRYLEGHGYTFHSEGETFRSNSNGRALVIYQDGHYANFNADRNLGVGDLVNLIEEEECVSRSEAINRAGEFLNLNPSNSSTPKYKNVVLSKEYENRALIVGELSEKFKAEWYSNLSCSAAKKILSLRNIPDSVIEKLSDSTGFVTESLAITFSRSKKPFIINRNSFVFWSDDRSSVKFMIFNPQTGGRDRENQYAVTILGGGYVYRPANIESPHIWLVESEMDSIALAAVNINAAADVRGTSVKKEERYIHLLFDIDTPKEDGGMTQGDHYTSKLNEALPEAVDERSVIYRALLKKQTKVDLGDVVKADDRSLKKTLSLILNAQKELERANGLMYCPESVRMYFNEKTGKISSNADSLYIALTDPEHFGIQFKRDVFCDKVFIKYNTSDKWEEFDIDCEVIKVIRKLCMNGFTSPSFESAKRIIQQVIYSRENRFDSMIERLNRLPEWDGVERCSRLFKDYVECEGSEGWKKAVGEYFFSALYGRASCQNENGVKCDITVALSGAGGIGKTTFCKLLAFDDSQVGEFDFDQDDAERTRNLRNCIIAEIPELGNMTKRDRDRVKSVLSMSSDRVRPVYKNNYEIIPRRWITVLTTNEDSFLKFDPSGAINRRFAAIKVLRVNKEKIVEDRDQFWAEAKVLYEKNGIMYSEVMALQETGANEDFVETPLHYEAVIDYLDSIKSCAVRTAEIILTEALNYSPCQIKRSDKQAVADILRKEGFESKKVRIKPEMISKVKNNGFSDKDIGKLQRVWVKEAKDQATEGQLTGWIDYNFNDPDERF